MSHLQSRTAEKLPAVSRDIHERLEPVVIEVFSEVDYYQANMREIARKAGMSFGTIYKYYKNKNHLLFSFIRYWFANLQDRIRDHLQGIENSKEKLRKAIWVHLDFLEKNEDIGRIIWIRIPGAAWMDDDTYKANPLLEIILEILHEGQADGSIDTSIRNSLCVHLIANTTAWAFIDWIYQGKERRLTDELQPVFEVIWRAVGSKDCA